MCDCLLATFLKGGRGQSSTIGTYSSPKSFHQISLTWFLFKGKGRVIFWHLEEVGVIDLSANMTSGKVLLLLASGQSVLQQVT